MTEEAAAIPVDGALQQWAGTVLRHPKDAHLVHALQAQVVEQVEAGTLPPKRVVLCVFSLPVRMQSTATEVHARALLRAASRCGDGKTKFCEAFAAVLRKKLTRFTTAFASVRLAMVRFACVVLENGVAKSKGEGEGEVPAWARGLLTSVSSLLEAMLEDAPRVQQLAHHALLHALRMRAVLVPSCLACIVEGPPETQQYALWLVIAHLELSTAQLEQLWTRYVFWAFEAKSRTRVALSKQDLRFRKLTDAQFDAIMHPTIAKALKKSPDSVLEAVVDLVHAVPLDLGRYVGDMFNPVFVSKLRSTKEDVRLSAISLAVELMAGCKNVESIVSIVSSVVALLDGKHGLLAQFYMREAAFIVLRDAASAIASLTHADEAVSVAQTVLPSLCKAVDKEANESTRMIGHAALGKWLAFVKETPADVQSKILAGLKNKSDRVVMGYLHSLGMLTLSAPSAHAVVLIQPFASELARIVQTAQQKPAVSHPDGLLSLGLLGSLACADSNRDSKTKEAIQSVLQHQQSFVISSIRAQLTNIPQSNAPELTSLLVLPQALLWALAYATDGQQADVTLEHRTFIDLLTCGNIRVRDVAGATIRSLYASSLDHMDTLLAAMENKLTIVAQEQETQRNAALASLGEQSADQRIVPTPGVLRSALRVLVSEHFDFSTVRASASIVARTLLLSHHPFIVAGHTAAVFGNEWKRHELRFVGGKPSADGEETIEDRMDQFLEDHTDVSDMIVARLAHRCDGALFSQFKVERLAAQRALGTLLFFAGQGASESLALHNIIEEALMDSVKEHIGANVTAEDLELLNTPDDVLFVRKDAKEADSKSRKKGSRRAANDDEAWEQEVREELAKKKKERAQSGKAVYTAEEKAMLVQQQQQRRELREHARMVACVIEVVEFLAVTRPDELHPALPVLLQSLQDLVSSHLLSSQSSRALCALTRAISPESMRVHEEDLAAALRVVLLLQHQALNQKNCADRLALLSDIFTTVLHAWMDVVFGFSLETEDDFDISMVSARIPPPTLHLCLPLLRAVLLWDAPPNLGLVALSLLAVNVPMIPEEEEEEVGDVAAQRMLRVDLIDLVLRLLGKQIAGEMTPIENGDLQPGAMLTSACLGPALSREEWALLVGDLGLLAASNDVRVACLRTLIEVAEQQEDEETDSESGLDIDIKSRLYSLCFDEVESTAVLGKQLWDAMHLQLPQTGFELPMRTLLAHTNKNVRSSSARALAAAVVANPETSTPLLKALQDDYEEHEPKAASMVDAFGNPTLRRQGQNEPEEMPETYVPRWGIALFFEEAAKANALSAVQGLDTVRFVVTHGLADRQASVRGQMREAGTQIVTKLGGGENTSPLLALLEQALEEKPKTQDPQDLERYDHQREGVVVLMGALAKHMAIDDPKVGKILDSLVDALQIPSEPVQRSVAACLASLLRTIKNKERNATLLTTLLARATSGETFGDRMGGAYGVSAVVHGAGIAMLKQQDVVARLEQLMQSGGPDAREGAMLVIECLSDRLGLLFEPYIMVLLPLLLKCFSDGNLSVREAASRTSRKMMAKLSGHGVKLVLPALLRALEDTQWRTKQASIQLLGSMAYCAPKPLGACLPQVVPQLTEALTDSHPKVRDASKRSLRDIGSVVRNPEIAGILPTLLKALEEPNDNTTPALQLLQSTSFQHAIDAPSLALVMPIISRGLKDRGGEAKQKAALIVGSMCSMINDAQDLVPYMETVLPSLQGQLMDPIPEVRAVASKALGKLVRGLGEAHFTEILTWLLDVLKGERYGSVERAGSAQGLCEVLVALGNERVASTLHETLLPLARHPKSSVREGVLWVLAFLPPVMGKAFAEFLTETLPVLVSGLSDDADAVRDVAMHAGHVVVSAHALSHTREILPSLESGLFDDHWRIRQSSVTLLGDLMYRISGTRAVGLSEVTGDVDEDDDAAGSAAGDRAIIKTLGLERRNAILASLYLIRSDPSALVRQSALQVWKSVVSNTPKTLRQILKTLLQTIVQALSGDHVEKQTMAGRALGEVVRKLGDHVLPEVVPILRSGLARDNAPSVRRGACLGLAEIISCCSKKQLDEFVGTLVDAVVDGLGDELPLVRASAAQAFDMLHRAIGFHAIDETVPVLLQRLHTADGQENDVAKEQALAGLEEILRVKSRVVLPYLIPRLLSPKQTVDSASMRTLSRVAHVTGSVLHLQIEKILSTLVPQYVIAKENDPMLALNIKQALDDVVLSIEDEGVHWLALELCKYCESEVAAERVLAFDLICTFGTHTTTHYSEQAPVLLRHLLAHLNDPESAVVESASRALFGMNQSLKPVDMSEHVDFMRQALNSIVSDARHRKGGVGATADFFLPGLCVPKGLEAFLPSYQYALMNGKPDLRHSAAMGLGELVEMTSPTALRPYLIKLTGPLIRIAGDRLPAHVKSAILHTLEIVLAKGGLALKPFLPQLQTTFVKALNDPAMDVRRQGAAALRHLVVLSPRIDALVAELTERVGTTTEGIREANVDALALIAETVGGKISPAVRSSLEEALLPLLEDGEESLRERATSCLVCLVTTSPDAEQAQTLVAKCCLADGSDLGSVAWQRKHSAAIFLDRVLRNETAAPWRVALLGELTEVLTTMSMDEQGTVRGAALQALATLVKEDVEQVDRLVPLLESALDHNSVTVCKHGVKIVKRLAKRRPDMMRSHLATLVPRTFELIKSNNLATKMSAERALLYLLEIHTRPETLADYVRSDAAQGRVISEYARRVLNKLKADSGDESD